MNDSELIAHLTSSENAADDIQYIKNPSERIKLAAVRQNGRAIRYIKNPSEAAIALARSKGYDRTGRQV